MLRRLFHTLPPFKDSQFKRCCVKDNPAATSRSRASLDKFRSSNFRGKENRTETDKLSKSIPINQPAVEETEQFLHKLEKIPISRSAPLFGLEINVGSTTPYGDAFPSAGSVSPMAGTPIATFAPIQLQYQPIPKAGKPSLRMSMFAEEYYEDDDFYDDEIFMFE